MPRPHPDRAAASLLTDVLDAHSEERWLVACDPIDDVTIALQDLGADVAIWHRQATSGADATAEPPAGNFSQVALRLPRDKVALELALELCAARMELGATLWLYGHNDEGVKSAGKRMAPWFTDITTVGAKRHCRLFRAIRGSQPARGDIAQHSTSVTIELPGGPHTFNTWPGLFAKGKLDPATALLLSVLDKVELEGACLDFASGMGVIAAALRQRTEGAVHACDVDALAVRATGENVRRVKAMVGDAWDGTPAGATYSLIVSNPPLHRGHLMDFTVLDSLIDQAPARLLPGGALLMVVQRQRPVSRNLKAGFESVEVLAENGKFRVWYARK
ncbi:MAG: 16S rRNA (guanine1207-N2)-methyltransferase [Kiritimatiellia bacterium]|jgi:16S rRNA (guanine1207-N2)-methyltransferase